MFMTRIPVGNAGSGESEDLAASTQYFPLVGVIVGGGAGLVFWLSQLMWSNTIAVTLCVLAAVLLTGGFHEDGLADVADRADVADSTGVWTAEKKLEVMRDSRIGTYGGLALIFCLILTVVTITDIANNAHQTDNTVLIVITTLVLAHVLGRWSSLLLIVTTPYARDNAANKVFVDEVTRQHLLVGSATALIVVFISAAFVSLAAFMAVAATGIVVVLSRAWFLKRIGGITGDCLGAANKIVEVCVYLSVAAALTS